MSRARVAKYFAVGQPQLRAFIRSLVFNSSDVDDIIQDVAVIAIEKADRYDGSRSIEAWVFGIAKNRVLKHLEKRKRQKLCFSGEAINAIADASLRSNRTSDSLEELQSCLGKLDPAHRNLLLKRHQPGMTARQLAREIDYTDTRMSRLLNALYQKIMKCVESQSSNAN